MATRPLRYCTAPGCPTRVESGRCQRHTRLAGRQRDTWTTLYGRTWPVRRLEYLAGNPECVLCGRMASIADHYPLGIRKLLALHVSDPHADDHLRALCQPCHARETGRREPGGWNRR